MSAGVVVMNKSAVALAADSAVTIGDHLAVRNSADKLFPLSRVAPIGLIAYANAELMGVPVEVIVSEYRKHLGDRILPRFDLYVEDFRDFIENNCSYFKFESYEEYFVRSFLFEVVDLVNKRIQECVYMNGKEDDDSIKCTINNVVNDFLEAKFEPIDNYNFSKYAWNKYFCNFDIEQLQKQPGFKWFSDEQIQNLCGKACELLNTTYISDHHVGMALAGYGNDEIYPSLCKFDIDGIINGHLRLTYSRHNSISDDNPSLIIPLAQTDVIDTFLFGLDTQLLQNLEHEIISNVLERFAGIDDSCFAQDKKDFVGSTIFEAAKDVLAKIADNQRSEFMKFRRSIAFLSIEELGLLAESLINITSIRRMVVVDQNNATVGGPIDVAVVSKGDGFIWLKKKHYFNKDQNPQYLYSRFDK